MKTKTILILLLTVFCFVSYAKPNHNHNHRPSPRPHVVKHIHRPHHIHKHHIHRNITPIVSFGTGLLVGSLINQQPTVITTQPTVVNPPLQKVWVNGYWITEYNIFGVAYQRYIPGHWEYR